MQKIKVLHIIKSLGRGGAEKLLPETLGLHDQDKFEFHYIYFLPWKKQMVVDIEEAGGIVTCYPSSNNIRIISQFPKVVHYCKREKIDVIHSHLPWSGLLSRLVFFKLKIPTVYTEHNIQERYHIVTKLLNKLTFNYQTICLAVSEDVKKSIYRNIGPNIKVMTVLNGVNTKCFKKDRTKGDYVKVKYSIPKDALVIGNVAVFREQKCLSDWLKAFKLINSKCPEVYGLLVGAGPQEEELKRKAEELALLDRVIFTGLQKRTVDFFSGMDIFMMSSAFEGLPIALLEAMSMRCAVISTKAGGVVEVVRHLQDGLLSEVGDWEDLSANALRLIEAPELMVELQNRARSRVVESFSLKNMVVKIESIYEGLV